MISIRQSSHHPTKAVQAVVSKPDVSRQSAGKLCYLLQDLVDVDLVGLNGFGLLLGSSGALGGFLHHLLGSRCLQRATSA